MKLEESVVDILTREFRKSIRPRFDYIGTMTFKLPHVTNRLALFNCRSKECVSTFAEWATETGRKTDAGRVKHELRHVKDPEMYKLLLSYVLEHTEYSDL